MKKLFLIILFTFVIIFSTSCSKDDSVSTIVTAKNLTTNIDENSSSGTILGKIIGASNTGTVNYTILSQSASGALAIDATSGEITIADASLFDFEINPQFTANIEVSDGDVKKTVTATVNLNNIDDIEFLLSTSKTKYKDATDGDWIKITKEEYYKIASNLNEIIKVGLNDSDYENDHTELLRAGNNFTLAITGGSSVRIPNKAYTIAFKYVSKSESERTNDRVKISSKLDPKVGYANLGEKLPVHSGLGEHFFIIKNNNTKNIAAGHLAFYTSKNIGYNETGLIKGTYGFGDVNSLEFISGATYHFQGLATTQKQW